MLSEQQHLVNEIEKHKEEVKNLQGKKSSLQNEVKQERKNFTDMQEKFKPRKDDLQRVNKLAKEVKPPVFSSKVSLSKEDWDFIINIAKQHARISDTTLAALENHGNDTTMMKRCQSLYLAIASEVAAFGYGDRSKLKQRVNDVLKDVDDRVIAWALDDMIGRKPSNLDEILEVREAKISKKYSMAKKLRDYNQPTITPKKTKKYSHDER